MALATLRVVLRTCVEWSHAQTRAQTRKRLYVLFCGVDPAMPASPQRVSIGAMIGAIICSHDGITR
eukprot:11164697-Lingulodinium_polyedra.AAC.1